MSSSHGALERADLVRGRHRVGVVEHQRHLEAAGLALDHRLAAHRHALDAQDLHEGGRLAGVGGERDREPVAAEGDREAVAGGAGGRVGVGGEEVLRVDLGGGLVGGVAGREAGGVERLLQLVLDDEGAAGVDREADGAHQRDGGERHDRQRVAALVAGEAAQGY
jgi:hypothetical protein